MADLLSPKGWAHVLGAATAVNHVSDNIKFLFYSGSTTSWTSWEFVSDLAGASIVARSANLSGKTVASGIFDANDQTLLAVSGSAFTHIIIYKDTGSDATSVLLAVMDILSFTPTGLAVTVVWNPSGLYAVAP